MKIPSASLSAVTALFVCLTAAHASPNDPASLEFFEKEIRPLLASRCYECHSAQTATPFAGLRLDRREDLIKGGRLGTGRSSGQAGGEPPDPPHPGTAGADATHRGPVRCADPVADRVGEDGSALDRCRGGCGGSGRNFPTGSAQAQPLGLAARPIRPSASGERDRVAAAAHGPVHSGQTGARGVGTGGAGGPVHPDPAPFLRSAGTPAPPRRGPGVRRRHLPASLRNPGGRLPGLAPVRRAVGPPLDGPDPLCRIPRQSGRPQGALRLALPRLPDSGSERRRALRPVDPGTPGGRPASLSQDEPGPGDQRVPPGHGSLPHGGAWVPAGGPAGRSHQVDRQPGRRRIQGLSGTHHLVRALPRPQVRRHQPGGLLRPVRRALRSPPDPAGHRRSGAPRLGTEPALGVEGGDPLAAG